MCNAPVDINNEFSRIVDGLYRSGELSKVINKMVREDLRDDFKQELFIIILSQDKLKIIEIHERGELNYFVIRIIINLVNQKKNIFHRKYLNNNLEIDKIPDLRSAEDNNEVEVEFIKVEKLLNNLDQHFDTFYYRLMIELLKVHGTMSEASRQTGIPISTISRAIAKVRGYLLSNNAKFIK